MLQATSLVSYQILWATKTKRPQAASLKLQAALELEHYGGRPTHLLTSSPNSSQQKTRLCDIYPE
jgi:hypothetical protein